MNAHADNQARTFLALFRELHPHIRNDRNLPARIQRRLARERRFGSRDRRLYREVLYTAIRHLPWVETVLARSEDEAVRLIAWLAADLPATRQFREAFVPQNWTSSSALTVADKVAVLGDSATASLLPDWFRTHCPAAFMPPTLDVLNSRAPLRLRLQTDAPDTVFAEFSRRGWAWKTSDIRPEAVELLSEADVTQTDAYAQGLVEIQDLGSQLILATVRPTPGERWLDACAGAGGKTLQLAHLLGPAGHVTAHDIRPAALAELQARASRARLRNVSISSIPDGLFDGVLVDAPCSGSGTWRRSPHLKWCTTEADIAAAAKLQGELLEKFSAHVRPGGLLIYATCSLSRLENDDIAAAFLAAHPHFTAASPARTILPDVYNTDGFFFATFRRTG